MWNSLRNLWSALATDERDGDAPPEPLGPRKVGSSSDARIGLLDSESALFLGNAGLAGEESLEE